MAPLDKVRRVLDYSVSEIPREKIFLGTPNYGYDWPLPYVAGQTEAQSLSLRDAIARAAEQRTAIEYNETAEAPYYIYYDRVGGRPIEHIVWFEDGRSVAATLDLLHEYDLRGLTVWNLMHYFPQLWTVLNNTFRIKRGI